MRIAEKNRDAKETKIYEKINLDGNGNSDIDTGIGFFDHMLTLLAFHSNFDLVVKADGALEVCDHHTIEDCGILLGKLFLGEIKAWETESDARNERKRNAQKRGEACCPRCGSVSIQYYSLGIPYEEYGEIKHLSNKYHCNNCGSEW